MKVEQGKTAARFVYEWYQPHQSVHLEVGFVSCLTNTVLASKSTTPKLVSRRASAFESASLSIVWDEWWPRTWRYPANWVSRILRTERLQQARKSLTTCDVSYHIGGNHAIKFRARQTWECGRRVSLGLIKRCYTELPFASKARIICANIP